jgi:hypothetical protein
VEETVDEIVDAIADVKVDEDRKAGRRYIRSERAQTPRAVAENSRREHTPRPRPPPRLCSPRRTHLIDHANRREEETTEDELKAVDGRKDIFKFEAGARVGGGDCEAYMSAGVLGASGEGVVRFASFFVWSGSVFVLV